MPGDRRTLDARDDQDEATLLRAARAGDPSALERLLAPYERPLYRLCLGVLRHAEDAEDAVQETVLRALRGIGRFRADSSVHTWLYRIAVNVCLERKRSRRPVGGSDELQREPCVSLPFPDESLVDRLQVLEALQALPPRQRIMLLLKEVDGCTAAEIARVMRCSERRVYHELHLAHRTLAQWRRDAAEEEGSL